LQVVTPQKTIDYRHNALGQRVAKLVNGQIAERYLWQDLTTLLATYDSCGSLTEDSGETTEYHYTSLARLEQVTT